MHITWPLNKVMCIAFVKHSPLDGVMWCTHLWYTSHECRDRSCDIASLIMMQSQSEHVELSVVTSCLCSPLERYFATLLFALMTTWSLELIPPSLLPLLHAFIKQFLSTADYQVIRQQEAKYEYIWSTIVPFVNLAYFPYLNPKYIPSCSSSDETQTVRQLQLLCIEAGVFSLQNMLSGNQTREILIQEELVDYVVCMPWYIPPGSRAQTRAHELVSCLHQTMQLQPPRLVTMVRAKLAALHFGLEKVLRTTSVHALLAEVLVS